MKKRIFLESDEFGREYFDYDPKTWLSMIDRLIKEAEDNDPDGVIRRIGVEVVNG